MPWQSGLAGLAYNGSVTKEIRTVDELLTRPDLKGKVTALSEMRDTIGLLLQSNGHDPANFTEAQFDDALAKLRKAVDSRTDPPVHRQRLRARAGQGRRRRVHRLVRRRDPALGRE